MTGVQTCALPISLRAEQAADVVGARSGKIVHRWAVIVCRMKTTVEIPHSLFRKAKSKAAERGQSLRQLVTEALQEKLAADAGRHRAGAPPWMQGFGKLRRLRNETRRLQARIDEHFEVIEPEDRA